MPVMEDCQGLGKIYPADPKIRRGLFTAWECAMDYEMVLDDMNKSIYLTNAQKLLLLDIMHPIWTWIKHSQDYNT